MVYNIFATAIFLGLLSSKFNLIRLKNSYFRAIGMRQKGTSRCECAAFDIVHEVDLGLELIELTYRHEFGNRNVRYENKDERNQFSSRQINYLISMRN